MASSSWRGSSHLGLRYWSSPSRHGDLESTRSVCVTSVFSTEEGTSLATRHAASIVPATEVRSLTNARLEYKTNVETKVNTVTFQVQTVSQVSSGGGLLIEGPLGFEFPTACQPEAGAMARGSTYQVEPMIAQVMSLPSDVVCTFEMGVSPGGRSTIRIAAGPSGLSPGLYRFQILGKNPSAVMANPMDNTKPCMRQHCWDFHLLQVLTDRTSRLDQMISVPSFAINAKMVEALLPTLTRAQQAATLRDDRPKSRNPLVFSFKLANTAVLPSEMLVRAPLGTIFREDCGEDVEVRPTEVFGTGQPLPAEYAEWPQGVSIVSCRGEGPDARIQIDPGVSDGLLRELFYPIRVATLHNPVEQPTDNHWTLDFNGESSDPFEGYILWTFTRTSLLTATTGRSTTVTGDAFFVNPVTITFRPRNTVKGAGMIIQGATVSDPLAKPLAMPQCTVAPTFHPGGLHVGPSIPWALQAHPEEKDTKDKDKEKEKAKAKPKRRPSWKERHQIVWSNDTQAPNTRSYFGRPVEKEDNPAIPRRRLRPTWRLEIAEEEHPVQAYQIFHAPSASWKEQGQWVMPDVSKLLEAMGSMSPTSPTEDGTRPASGFGPRDVPTAEVKEPERGNPLLKAVQEAQKRASEQRKKVNTPSLPCDLPHQRPSG
eukprot:symbB.v1.2.007627.t1/scaffold470.1/size199496/4